MLQASLSTLKCIKLCISKMDIFLMCLEPICPPQPTVVVVVFKLVVVARVVGTSVAIVVRLSSPAHGNGRGVGGGCG